MTLTKQNFVRYSELKKQIKEAEEEIKALQPELKSEMEEIGPDAKIEMEVGSFSFMKKKKWAYSEKVIEARVGIKEMEKAEEADGTATFEEDLILMFKEKKS